MTTSLSEQLDSPTDRTPDVCACCRATVPLQRVQSHSDPEATVGVCVVCLSIGAWEAQKPRLFTPDRGAPVYLVDDDARTLRAIAHSTNMYLNSLNLIGEHLSAIEHRMETHSAIRAREYGALKEDVAAEGTTTRHKIDVVREAVVVMDERLRLSLDATTKNFDALDTSVRTHLEELDVAVESVASDVAQVSIRGQELAHMATRIDARLDSAQGKLSNVIQEVREPKLHRFDGFTEKGMASIVEFLKMLEELADTPRGIPQ